MAAVMDDVVALCPRIIVIDQGVLIHDGAAVMAAAPWMILFPAGALSISVSGSIG